MSVSVWVEAGVLVQVQVQEQELLWLLLYQYYYYHQAIRFLLEAHLEEVPSFAEVGEVPVGAVGVNSLFYCYLFKKKK